ncbi:MAG: Bug family tripartite tricarboxylate transporter substrate binding protein [Burkholderiaceae bacterium]|jgi:tripartite-type tricarboxylate transporter receptor subunit TctC
MKPALLSIILALCGAMLPQASQAQDFPAKTVRLVVPFPPGGIADALARILGEGMSKSFNQQVVVENRPGAGGNLAASAVATAPADGYALFLGLISTHAINVHLYQQLPYDPIKDFQPIGRVAQAPLLLVVPPSLPVKSVAEFIAHAKANPGKLNYGSAGNGSASHLAMSMFSTMAGIQLVHVPYKGTGPLKVDLFTGLLQGYFDAQVSAMGDIQSGKVRLIGVGSRGRLPAFPEIAPISETVAGYEFNTWYGMFAPAGLSAERVRILNRTLNQVLADPATRTRFDSQGLEATASTPEALAAFVASETERMGKVVRQTGARAD